MRQESSPVSLKIAAHQHIEEREYWLKKLSGSLIKSNFPYDSKWADRENRSIDTHRFTVSEDVFSEVMLLCSGSDYTLNAVLATVLVVLLGKYTGNEDILIGMPIYKQKIEGELINKVLALRNQFNQNMTFKEMLFQVRQTIMEAMENYNYPIELLIDELNLSASQNGSFPLFGVSMLLENIHDRNYFRHIKANVNFSFQRTQDSLDVLIEYNSNLYTRETINKISDHFLRILCEVMSNVDVQVGSISFLTDQERRVLLYDFNDTDVPYPDDSVIHELIEKQVQRSPDNIAVVFEDHCLTYAVLNKASNRLARRLRKKGVESGCFVGVIIDHSIEMIIGLLAILKTGGAYLPIDIETPQNRVVSMLDDCQSFLLLTTSSILKRFSFTALQNMATASVKDPFITPPRAQIMNLDSLPFPDATLIDYDKYSRYIGVAVAKFSVSIIATRGCPFRCAYCHKIWPKKHVVRSAENIFEEIKIYYDVGVRRFVFLDDVFNLDKKNSKRFLELVIESGFDVQFFFTNGLRGDLLSKDYIDLLVKAGTVEIGLSLETASPRLQKLIGKNLNVDKLRENIDYILEKHPHVLLKLQTMHGFPTETKEEARMTLDFLINRKWMHLAYVHILKIFPNTDMETIALENGISPDAIAKSDNLAYHEMPQTLPFEKDFTLNYQTEYLNEYLLSKVRFLDILPKQMKVFSEDEIVKKYDSILPAKIGNFSDLLRFAGIDEDELDSQDFLGEESIIVPDLNRKLKKFFPEKRAGKNALRVLLLDLSIFFSGETDMLYDIVVPPTGLMYVMSYLNQQLGDLVYGRIAKSRVDFDNYNELKSLLEEFKPDVIGIRSMAFYKDFFHKTISLIRDWGFAAPIIAGGPYATSDYARILQDPNVDVVVRGEGEVTFTELIREIIENDKKLPDERILKDIAGIAFIPKSIKSGNRSRREIVLLDNLFDSLLEESDRNLEASNEPVDLAYTIFTSGSTGQPKGVMIEHKSLVNLCHWHNSHYMVTSGDHAAKFARLGFDASVWEIYPYLVAGATLYLLKDEMKYDIVKLNDYFEKNNVTIGFLPTKICEQFIQLENRSLRTLLTGGDKLIHYSDKGFLLVNNYGPTENTVVTTSFVVDREYANIPIGQPINNCKVYVVDDHANLQSMGATGELFIAGAGLARGYLNNPELTAEKFVKSPYLQDLRMYRSGDMARRLKDGNIEFLGRLDNQVKIRGCRLELGEIEKILVKHHDIKEAIVTAVKRISNLDDGEEGRDKDLCAYYIAQRELPASELVDYLSMQLPYYMLPSYFIQMDCFPLTSNGKVDRKILPKPESKSNDENYIAPRDEVERRLAGIWADVLEIDREIIGIDSNFFDLGGHSLSSTILVSRIGKEFQIPFSIRFLFLNQRLKDLADKIRNTQPEEKTLLKMNAIDNFESPERHTSQHYKKVRKPLLSLFLSGEIEPVDAVVIGYLNDILVQASHLTPDRIINDYLENKPVLKSVVQSPHGRLGVIWLPLFGSDLYTDKNRTLNSVFDAIEIARQIGARTVSLAGSIPSALDYGQSIIAHERFQGDFPVITTGHDTTVASLVLSIKKMLDDSKRNIANESLGVLGLGSIGASTLYLMLKNLLPPGEIILCDVYKKSHLLKKIRQRLENVFNFKGKIRILESKPGVPEGFYDSSLIIGATNIPEVLDIAAVKPGTLIVDDSNCFNVERAFRRFNTQNDILFTSGGTLKSPRPLSMIDYVPENLDDYLDGEFDLSKMVSCAFSSLLCASYEDLSPCIGEVSVDSSCQHYQRLVELEYQAPEPGCFHYILEEEKIYSFYNQFGG